MIDLNELEKFCYIDVIVYYYINNDIMIQLVENLL